MTDAKSSLIVETAYEAMLHIHILPSRVVLRPHGNCSEWQCTGISILSLHNCISN